MARSTTGETTMQAVVQDKYGETDVLRIEDVDRPAVADGEVLVRVYAAGLDRGVWHLVAGLPYPVRLAGYGLRAPNNRVRGREVAGRVETIGRAVRTLQVGDEVFGIAEGSFAEYTRAREDRLAPKPQNLTFEQAAVATISALTALQGVRDGGQVQAGELFDVKPIAGSLDDLDVNAIAVFEDVAKEKDLQVGDRLPTEFAATGRKDLTVRFIYGENQPAGDYLLGREAFEANFPDQLDFQVFVKQADGVSTTDALGAIEREADRYPGAKVLDQTEYKAEQTQFVDQILGLVYALLFLAILIALLGIGNTLALSIFERTRELGVMRAVGMTRAQLRSTIRWESVIIALQGTLLGLVIGLFFGWALVTALEDEGLNTFRIPTGSLAIVVVLAALAGVVAAVLPARRAAKLDVLRAMVTE
jgi:putative ABC transport system permease protein